MRRFVTITLISSALSSAWAQPPARPSGPPPSSLTPVHSNIDSAKRTLQPGDLLEIHIFTLPELEKSYQIRADGTFYHPFAGEVPAQGKTLKQLEAYLLAKFQKELRKPNFRLGLKSMADNEASVLGEVGAQGKYKFAAGTSVMDLLAQAGGVSEKADKDTAVIMRGGKEIPLNLNSANQLELAKLMVQNGDIIYIHRGNRVGVSGEVQAKGVYAISTRSTNPMEEIIKSAGGATEAAALNRIQIIRPSLAQPIDVNLYDPATTNVTLQDGDTVVVPARKVVVMGAVGKAGPMPLANNETLLNVISQAGVTEKSRINEVVVVRAADVMSGTDKKEVYNFEEGMGKEKSFPVVPIHDGDLVYIPPKGEGIGGFNGLLGIILMARSLFTF